MIECKEEPPQYTSPQAIGYIPKTFPWSEMVVAAPVYFYNNKWWNIEWYGLWFVEEHLDLEEEIIFESKEDALLVGA